METAQLGCFITVAQTLNFSEAARRCHVSQPTISRYIGELEREFGVQLFLRSRRDVMLTDEGRALLPYAREVMQTLERARTVIGQMQSGGTGRIRVGYDATAGRFPGKCLAAFAAEYPAVAVDLEQVSGGDLAQALRSGDYDFLFLPRDLLPENGAAASMETHCSTLSLAARRGALPAAGQDLRALQDVPLVLLSETENPILYMEVLELFSVFHISPKIVSQHESVDAVLMAVGAGLGVTILPTETAAAAPADLVESREIESVDTGIPYAVAWREDSANPAAQLFLQTVQRLAEPVDTAPF